MYEIHMHLDSFNMITSDGSEYIATTFLLIHEKNTYCMCV
jgi:hypothetical protein